MNLEPSLCSELQALPLSSYVFDKHTNCFYNRSEGSDALKMRDIVKIIDKLNEHHIPYHIKNFHEISITPIP